MSLFAACRPDPGELESPLSEVPLPREGPIAAPGGGPLVAHLKGGDPTALDAIRAHFVRNNPGYELEFVDQVVEVAAREQPRIAFVQEIYPDGATRVVTANSERPSVLAAEATLIEASGAQLHSQMTVGDLVVLAPGMRLRSLSPLSLLLFVVPEPPSAAVPPVVRPDWDEAITDTPGGCATEDGAYRRILLTWLDENGPYTYEGLNAHRVRITDSFTHYHPLEGGFDEFYLVQMANDQSKILTSLDVAAIEAPDAFDESRVAGLLHQQPLEVGDLVYLPRGMAHRGLGGVLAQVITVPGFKPGAEIGLDHHLRAINERFELSGETALPYNEAASLEPVVR